MKHYISLLMLATAMGCQAQTFTIQTNEPRQTIRHFGASDAWSMQFIGLWDNEAEQQKVADWLFSTENDAQGKPLGIGLSVWRFNLGAGSAEQGKDSQINPGTRTECFLTKDGTYDWTKQAGQRKFLRLAKERGVPYFLAFLNSAPVYFTQNGLATNTGRGGNINLKDDCYDDFAKFMATAVKGIEQHEGIVEGKDIVRSAELHAGFGEFPVHLQFNGHRPSRQRPHPEKRVPISTRILSGKAAT